MISKQTVRQLAEERIKDRDERLFIVELTISASNVIRLELDKTEGNVSIEDCMSVSRNIEHNLDREDADFELLSDSDLSVLVFRYVRPEISDLNALNQYIKMKLFYSGEILVASTKVDGNFYLKFTFLNPITTTEDVHQILTTIKSHGKDFNTEK